MYLQAELGRAQDALKAARSESARRLRELQQQSQQHAAAVDSALSQQLEAETAAREAAEGKLRDARTSLARHKQLVSDLRSKVDRSWQSPQHDPVYQTYVQLTALQTTRGRISAEQGHDVPLMFAFGGKG